MIHTRHRQATPNGSATTPFWSLTLPRWAAVRVAEPRPVQESPPARAAWICAKCGACVKGISAATEHIELHRSEERRQPASACVPGRVRVERRRPVIGAERERGRPGD